MKLKKKEVARLTELLLSAAMTLDTARGSKAVLEAMDILGVNASTMMQLVEEARDREKGLLRWTTRVEAMEFDCPDCAAPAESMCTQEVVMVQKRRASHAARHFVAVEHGASPQPFSRKAVIL